MTEMPKGVCMNIKPIFFYILIITGLLLSASGSLPSGQSSPNLQATATAPVEVTVPPIIETVIVPGETGTPVVIPVTGGDGPTGLWMIVLFGLLALLGIAFLLALFTPRTTHEHIDRNPPPPEV
jgi:hypothetical protein